MATFGDRLRLAIDQRFGSIRKFQKELKRNAPALKGTSRQTLYRYFEGESEPPAGFVVAAAEVLGVRREWLALEHGGKTDEEERARQAQLTAAKPESVVYERIAAVFAELDDLSIGNQSLVYEALTRFLSAVPPGWSDPDGGLHPDVYDRFLMGMRQAVGAPLRMWGREDWRSQAVQDYIRAALNAFILAIPAEISAPPELHHLEADVEPTEAELREMVRQLKTAAAARGYDLGL